MAAAKIAGHRQSCRRLFGFVKTLALAGFWTAFPSHASVILQEDFNYPQGILGTNPAWTGATSQITVTSINLQFPNLTGSAPASFSAAVNQGPTAWSYRPLTATATGGVVYFSFLINFTLLPGSYYIAGLLQSTNAPPGGSSADPLDLIDDASASGFKLGVRARGGPVNYITNSLTPLNTNTTYFVVMKYNFTNGGASLYLDPQPGAAEPSVPDATSTASAVVPNLADVYLRSGSSSAGNFLVSTLCVASTWSEATAGTVTSNAVSADGTRLNAFLDSFQVANFWLDGYSVNWMTGATNGSGPNMTAGTASHCSVFAPSVAQSLGIYLLCPPAVSDIDLANAQAQWFVTNTNGWFPISSVVTAQHMANTGVLIMASYLASNPDDSGHIAILRASTRTDASVYSYGAEECQSGESNYSDTNLVTGFNQHPGAFPVNIYFYGHAVNYPVTPVWPALSQDSVSHGVFQTGMTTIVGRPYQIQWSSDLVNWSPLLTFTNSNLPASFFTNASFSNLVSGATRKFYSIQPIPPQ
jgi:hypothetical protein